MRFNKFKYLIILISLGLIACKYSNPYRSGKIEMIIQDNAPCVYMKEDNQTGSYLVTLNQYETPAPTFSYTNTFEKNYPKKDNCLLVNNKIFKNFKLDMNTSYDMYFETTPPNQDSTYRKRTFCIKQDRNNFVVQDSVGGKCRDIPVEETTKQKFFRWIHQFI